MRKLVLFDIDGTLVSYSTNPGHIPDPTKQAIAMLGKAGHTVAVATGRSLLTARSVMEQLGIGHAVLCGGAHVISGGQVVQLDCMEQEIAERIAERSMALGCSVFACSDKAIFLGNCDEESWEYVRRQSGDGEAAQSISLMNDVCMMSIYGENLPEKALLEDNSITEYHHALEVRAPGITKASGMVLLAKSLGIPLEDIVAVGDNENDVEMLRTAGIGIAVGNCSDGAKAAADIVADSIEESGILTVMKQIHLI